MATPVGSEWLEVDGLPLSTPAWRADPTALYGAGRSTRSGVRVAYHRGERVSPAWPMAQSVALPMIVHALVDPDGNPHPDAHTGRRRNMDALKRALRPRLSGDGTVRLVHRLSADDDRDARVQVVDEIVPGLDGLLTRVLVPLWLPDGVLRSVTPTVVSGSGSAAFTLAVPNPGSTDQLDATITLTGDATAVEITSPAFGGLVLDYTGSLGTETAIDTGGYTAVRDGLDVHGLVTASGGPGNRWLPISPSPNLLSANKAAIETAVGGWAANNGVIARETVAGHPHGDAAVEVTPTAGAAVSGAWTAVETVAEGTVVTLSAWVRPPLTTADLVWGNSSLSGSWASDVVTDLAPGVWQRIVATRTVPAGEDLGRVFVRPCRPASGTLADTDVGWFAAVQLERGGRATEWVRTDMWTITPTGGSVTVEVEHRAAWA